MNAQLISSKKSKSRSFFRDLGIHDFPDHASLRAPFPAGDEGNSDVAKSASSDRLARKRATAPDFIHPARLPFHAVSSTIICLPRDFSTADNSADFLVLR